MARAAYFALCFAACALAAQSPPRLEGVQSAILVEAKGGRALFEKDADRAMAPASLTKLVTMALALESVDAGDLALDEVLIASSVGNVEEVPDNSTVMFLREGARVSVNELLLGLSVASANDAAIALAERIAGSVQAFAERMNQWSRQKGYASFNFAEPSGLGSDSRISARDFAAFCRDYIRKWPQSLERYHSVKEWQYPEKAGRLFKNGNQLLSSYEGCDGLKTGYLPEAGYTIAVTAKRGDTRFIAVVLGARDPMTLRGAAASLLDYGFGAFRAFDLGSIELPRAKVWGGSETSVALVARDPLSMLIPKDIAGPVNYRIDHIEEIEAPVAKGTVLGELIIVSGGKVIARNPLVASKDIGSGGILAFFRDIARRLLGW
jgi:D-alanyl-D-alanine carboxypeptidase (penicillin-binding protein 5/6)